MVTKTIQDIEKGQEMTPIPYPYNSTPVVLNIFHDPVENETGTNGITQKIGVCFCDGELLDIRSFSNNAKVSYLPDETTIDLSTSDIFIL